jgi:S-adenosylmethionine:tRNA ribosyltransferase-isomerase
MSPATWPRPEPLEERLLVVDPAAGAFEDARVRKLPEHLHAGDVVVVNDAATIPASLAGSFGGAPLEVRLAGREGEATFRAVLFGAGDWRTKTEDRPPPPRVRAGDVLSFGAIEAEVVRVHAASPRLVTLRFLAREDEAWRAIFRVGQYVQYAYTARTLKAWHVQTPYAGEPWASEMPSAGRPLAWEVLEALGRRGVALARITHAAGLSATGDPALDAALPLPERFRVPAETVRAIEEAKRAGGRVVAIGTTVVRALEGAAALAEPCEDVPRAISARGLGGGRLTPREGVTDLVIGPGFVPEIVDGLVTGLHERGASHFSLLGAFAARPLLERAYAHAERVGYLCHEFGDSSLVLPGALRS